MKLFAKIVLSESSKCNLSLNKLPTEILELSMKQKLFSLHILHNDAFTRANRFRSIFSVTTNGDIIISSTLFSLHLWDISKILRVSDSHCKSLWSLRISLMPICTKAQLNDSSCNVGTMWWVTSFEVAPGKIFSLAVALII